MILTNSTSVPRTTRLDTATGQLLRQATRVERYNECGWSCATGFDAEDRVTVMVHANTQEEITDALAEPGRRDDPYRLLTGRY